MDMEFENMTIHVPTIDSAEPINVNNIPTKDITAMAPYFLDDGVKLQDISKNSINTFIRSYKNVYSLFQKRHPVLPACD